MTLGFEPGPITGHGEVWGRETRDIVSRIRSLMGSWSTPFLHLQETVWQTQALGPGLPGRCGQCSNKGLPGALNDKQNFLWTFSSCPLHKAWVSGLLALTRSHRPELRGSTSVFYASLCLQRGFLRCKGPCEPKGERQKVAGVSRIKRQFTLEPESRYRGRRRPGVC